jgi:hypothetical protein
MWVLGYKTERGHAFGRADFEVRDGGRLEILGGVTGVGSNDGILKVRDADASLVACTTSGGAGVAETIVAVEQAGARSVFAAGDFPDRPCSKPQQAVRGKVRENVVVPLFVNRRQATEPPIGSESTQHKKR